MFRRLLFVFALVQSFAFQDVNAAILSADFNGLATGDLTGKGGGTGFTGNWAGSNTIDVSTAGDLTSVLYNKPQSGTPTRITGASTGSIRQVFRTAAVPLTGEIWFSFLAQPQTADDSRVGISMNGPTASSFDNRGNVFFQMNAGTSTIDTVYRFGDAADQTSATTVAVSTTPILVVGQMNLVGGGGADSIKIWLNPDIATNADMSLYTPVVNDSGTNFADSLTHFGLIMYRNTTSGVNLLDNVYFSDGGGNAAQAFFDVTGINAVPEPGSWVAISAVGGALLLVRRQRR